MGKHPVKAVKSRHNDGCVKWEDTYLQEQLSKGKRGLVHPIQECYSMLDISAAVMGDGMGQLISLPETVEKHGAEVIEEKTHECLENNADKVNDLADKSKPWVALDSQGGFMWIMPPENELEYRRLGFDWQGAICAQHKIQYIPCCAKFHPVGMIDWERNIKEFRCAVHGKSWKWNSKGKVVEDGRTSSGPTS